MGSWVSERDHRRGWSVVGACVDVRTRGELIARLLPQLQPLLGSDEVSSSTVELLRWRVTAAYGYPTLTSDLPDVVSVWRTRPQEHPWAMHYAHSLDDATMLLSDHFPGARLHRLPYYAEFYRPRHVRYAAYCVIAQAGSSVVGVGAGRWATDYTDRERDLLDHLRRPLGALWQLAAAREQLDRLELPVHVPALAVDDPCAAEHRPALDGLTPAERQVVMLVLRGLDNRRIALSLGVSVKAVEQHLTHVFRKVGVCSRTQLALVVAVPHDRRVVAGVFPIAGRPAGL